MAPGAQRVVVGDRDGRVDVADGLPEIAAGSLEPAGEEEPVDPLGDRGDRARRGERGAGPSGGLRPGAAAVATNVAFTVLSSVFRYPDVLKEPTDAILTAFRAHQSAVTGWFIALAASAALFAPIAVGVGRLSDRRAMRWAVPVGIAAAVVQVVGLSRWALLVPGYAADATSNDPAVAAAARDAFKTAHRVLGNVIGETFGYAFTAAWTLLVLVALGRTWAGRWFTALGALVDSSRIVAELGVKATPVEQALAETLSTYLS